jgi:hypothetical protein
MLALLSLGIRRELLLGGEMTLFVLRLCSDA